MSQAKVYTHVRYKVMTMLFFPCPCSHFMDENDDAESQKFLSNGMMKKKKYEEYHEEYVRGVTTLLSVGQI